jgi:hypothetical protein
VDALLAGFEQCAAGLGQSSSLVHVAHKLEDVLALEIATWGDAISSHESVCVVAQYLSDYIRRPDKELAFLPLAIGVLGGVKGNTCGVAWQLRLWPQLLVVGARANVRHFAHNVIENLLGDGAKELVARNLPGVEIDAG